MCKSPVLLYCMLTMTQIPRTLRELLKRSNRAKGISRPDKPKRKTRRKRRTPLRMQRLEIRNLHNCYNAHIEPQLVPYALSVQELLINQGCHASGKNQGKQNFRQVREFWKMSGNFCHLTHVKEFCHDIFLDEGFITW